MQNLVYIYNQLQRYVKASFAETVWYIRRKNDDGERIGLPVCVCVDVWSSGVRCPILSATQGRSAW